MICAGERPGDEQGLLGRRQVVETGPVGVKALRSERRGALSQDCSSGKPEGAEETPELSQNSAKCANKERSWSEGGTGGAESTLGSVIMKALDEETESPFCLAALADASLNASRKEATEAEPEEVFSLVIIAVWLDPLELPEDG